MIQHHTVKEKILIVGCGDLGGEVAKLLSSHGHEVIGVSRSAKPIQDVTMIQADVTIPKSLLPIQNIQPTIVIYCVAANGQNDVQYKAHYVDGLSNILETQQNNQLLKHVFFVSSTRVYGQNTQDLLDESMPAIAADFGGERLLEAESLLKHLSCHSTVLRLSGIYGPGRLRMIRLASDTSHWPAVNSWTNRIHRDDAARFIDYLIEMLINNQSIAPCYIVTDEKPTQQYEVLHWIANQLAIPFETTIPSSSGGKKLSNKLMLSTHFKLLFPSYETGYLSLIEKLTK